MAYCVLQVLYSTSKDNLRDISSQKWYYLNMTNKEEDIIMRKKFFKCMFVYILRGKILYITVSDCNSAQFHRSVTCVVLYRNIFEKSFFIYQVLIKSVWKLECSKNAYPASFKWNKYSVVLHVWGLSTAVLGIIFFKTWAWFAKRTGKCIFFFKLVYVRGQI